jgi:hypothetical protein
MGIYAVMAKRFSLVALLTVLLLLSACGIEPPVFVTETPEGTPQPTDTVSATVAPTIEVSPTSVLNPSPTRQIPTNTPLPTATQVVSQRDCMRISYNINGFAIRDWEYLKRHLVATQPCSVLMMDDIKRTLELLDLLPNSLIIYRGYSGFEGGQCVAEPPRQQIDNFVTRFKFIAREIGMPEDSYKRVALYGCSNEPSWGGNTALSQILSANIEFMRYAREEYNLTVVSGNWGVGNFDPFDVENGVYHDYLVALETYQQFLGVHEYATLYVPWGTGLYSRECLLEGLAERFNPCVQRENWATVEDIQPRRWHPAEVLSAQSIDEPQPIGVSELAGYYYSIEANAVGTGFLPPYWLMFRSLWLDIYALDNGIARPNKILTEAFHDHINNYDHVGPGEIQPLTYLESIFGIERYMFDIRGAPSHCRLYVEYYYPNQTCAESIFEQYVWWDTVADETYHSANIFTWSDEVRTGVVWSPFNVSGTDSSYDLYKLHGLLEDYAMVVTGS